MNLALSGRRRKRPWLRLGDSERDDTPDPADTDPTLPLERAERERLVQEALNSLAPDHRAVVVLKEFDGLRYEEIAAVLGVPVGTVRSRLHRARCDLKERLRPLMDDEARSRAGHVLGPADVEPLPPVDALVTMFPKDGRQEARTR